MSHHRCKPVHFHTKSQFMLQPPPPCSSPRAPGSPCPAACAPCWGEAGRKTLAFLHGLLKPVTGRVRKVVGAPRKEINACKGNWTGKFQTAPATGEASKGSKRSEESRAPTLPSSPVRTEDARGLHARSWPLLLPLPSQDCLPSQTDGCAFVEQLISAQ